MAKIQAVGGTVVTSWDQIPEGQKPDWYPQEGLQMKAWRSDQFEVYLGGPKGTGKASHCGARVQTPFGAKEMADIRPGSLVSNPDGTVATVVAVHPQGKQRLYRVTFADGASTKVTEDHLWLARLTARELKADRRQWPFGQSDSVKAKIYTTSYLLKHIQDHPVAAKRDEWGNGSSSILVPLTNPISISPGRHGFSKDSDIPPYTLGALLGDGCFRSSSVSFTTADHEISDRIRFELDCELTIRPNRECPSYTVVDRGRTKQKLEALGLYGKLSFEKFIPKRYMHSTAEVRTAILQGLMDTDGYAESGGVATFSTTSKQLAKDVQWISRSLGYKAKITSGGSGYRKQDGERVECRDSYGVWIRGVDMRSLFHLTRKKDRCKDTFNGASGSKGTTIPMRKIISIESDGFDEAQCITVDHPNGLYLTDDFIVTHNSHFAMGWLLKGNIHVPDAERTPVDWSYVNHALYRAVVLRRNSDDLNDWFEKSKALYMKLGAKASKQPWEFSFPTSGAKIVLGHLADTDSYMRYTGQMIVRYFIDEITFIQDRNLYMKVWSSCRSPHLSMKAQILLASNPEGPGLAWVTGRFVDVKDKNGNRVPPGTTIIEKSIDPISGDTVKRTRVFIRGDIRENKEQIQSDPSYYARLAGLPPQLRAAYLDGDYFAMQGRYFTEFRPNGPLTHEKDKHPNANHVISAGSVELMPWWPRMIAMDWGYKHYGAAGKGCQHPNGQFIAYDELVQQGVGAYEWGMNIAQWCLKDLAGLESHTMTLWLSPDAFGQRNDEKTLAEQIQDGIRRVLGPDAAMFYDESLGVEYRDFFKMKQFQTEEAKIVVRRARHQRVPGWTHMRELLRYWDLAKINRTLYDADYAYGLLRDEGLEKYVEYCKSFQPRKPEILPKLQFVKESCPRSIQALESLVHDPDHPEDVLKTESVNDDVGDMLRYLCMGQQYQVNREPPEVYADQKVASVLARNPGLDPTSAMQIRERAYQEWELVERKHIPFSIGRGSPDRHGVRTLQ